MAKVTFDNRNNQFYQTLKIAVDQYFEEKKTKKTGDWRLYIKTITLVSTAIIIYVSLLFFKINALPALCLCAILGYVFACIGFAVMHDANHGSYSTKPWLNDALGL